MDRQRLYTYLGGCYYPQSSISRSVLDDNPCLHSTKQQQDGPHGLGINYYPALMITGKTSSLAKTLLGLAAPVVGVLWFCFAVVIFRLGLRRYTSAGI